MQNGLAFINGNKFQQMGKAVAKKVDQVTGKYVIKDQERSAEVFELLGFACKGMNGGMEVRLRSTYSGQCFTLPNFWDIRPAFPNEAQANARQGSEQFKQYWANNAFSY
ncbi:hypothetical protein [Acinetobacter proteolyticus]|uniref:Uncharacterized protein n=1 Tax=Acinetobacter proteolyticus TaxID=1776741 RepID=A0A2N0WI97_9GAMM|nr:hypothetical protein [Acinetobacter proteolyticus]PKF35518.1 hypothetical protein CW311_04305 [Acinetobacter proteolyticus]